MPNVFIFDLDDTILMSNTYKNYSDITPNTTLNYFIDNLEGRKFIYTNGTYGHGVKSLEQMNNTNIFTHIFARDKLPFMKPDYRSYNFVQNLLYYNFKCSNFDKHIFFDDLPNNLLTAKSIGWTTVWINPKCNDFNFEFIDHKFETLLDALIYFKNNI